MNLKYSIIILPVILPMNYKFLGACCSYGQKSYGPSVAPIYIEERLNMNMEKIRINPMNSVFDYDRLYSRHYELISENKNIITIGGDHSISYSTVNSALNKYGNDLHVVWVDAHADLNTQSTSITHNLHGMPVGHLMGFENHPIATFNNNILDDSQITYIGIRDLDTSECLRLLASDIEYYNIFSYTSGSLEYIRKKLQNKKIYLSIDLDVLDPIVFPCTGTRVKNGLNIHELFHIVNTLKENTVGMEIVEFNPLINKDFNDMCLNNIKRLITNYTS